MSSAAIEYLGVYLHQKYDDLFIKLCDSQNFIFPKVQINDAKVVSLMKLLFAKLTDDVGTKKAFNFNCSYFIFRRQSVYFVFVADNTYTASDEMFVAIYQSLADDIESLSEGNLRNLQTNHDLKDYAF